MDESMIGKLIFYVVDVGIMVGQKNLQREQERQKKANLYDPGMKLQLCLILLDICIYKIPRFLEFSISPFSWTKFEKCEKKQGKII